MKVALAVLADAANVATGRRRAVTIAEAITIIEAQPGYAIVVTPDRAGGRTVYVARHPALPGCMSHGDTPEEAISNLAEARGLYLEAAGRRGVRVPEPVPGPDVMITTPVAEPAPVQATQTRWRLMTGSAQI